ncbi:LOW QUALITY PROTEIN: hypothetical protein RJ639_040192 [Escallonia herrerae]|uniref:Uncharacterized protein n=1 Tax=Escallonia herrerae TaxID=1293975 RepID=A0AA88WJI7_9ASTE|nr:LOW QUALITY PROTEIN: hypothetical protein RJ639_040192 [Escallonia herrerae]
MIGITGVQSRNYSDVAKFWKWWEREDGGGGGGKERERDDSDIRNYAEVNRGWTTIGAEVVVADDGGSCDHVFGKEVKVPLTVSQATHRHTQPVITRRHASLSFEFAALQSQHSQLASSLQQRLAELAQLQANKPQGVDFGD